MKGIDTGLILGIVNGLGLAIFTYISTRPRQIAEVRKENTGSDVLILQQNADYVKRLEDRLDVLSDKIDRIEKINDNLKTENETLAREKVEYLSRISTLEEKVTHLENELTRYQKIEQNLKEVDIQSKVEAVVADITKEVIK